MKLKFSIAVLALFIGCGLAVRTSVAFQDQEDKQKQEKETDKPTIQERIQAAGRLAQSGDPEEALEMLKEIQAENPDNLIVSANLMSLMQRVGMEKASEERTSGNEFFYGSAKIARKLKDKPGLPAPVKGLIATSIYNEACTYAIDGKGEEALKSLQEALDVGFDNLELAETDSDFGDLLESKEFKAIIETQKKKIEEAKKAAEQARKDKLIQSVNEFESYEFDFDLEDVDGETVKKADFKGKILIVDLWGTWCPPCRREIPSFIKLKKNYGEKLDIVGIAYERADDDEEALEKVQSFMEKNDMNYRCALGTDKIKEQVPDMRGYPTTLFIDSAGKVRMELVGFQTYDDLELVVKEIMSK